ncbi:Protein RALF-like 24 [Cardamine amara subsp. amara]|uniref:Protein RALF-like 24 n=1 Tax=Cardamine amara subsp. amara TaxID=228776 RepID=A0ABD1A416_CARAN
MSRFLALLYLSLLCLQTHLSISVTVPISSVNGEIDAMLARNSVIGEEEGEEMMPSEISRRVMMMRKQYISYETLRRDMVPCQKPGASYYACRSGQANSYNRGCNIITRCVRDSNDIKN